MSVAETPTQPDYERVRISPSQAVRDTWVITRRNLVRNVRLPQLLLLATVQPVMFLLLFTFVFGGAIVASLPEGVGYLQFLMPGLLVQVAAFGAGQTALGLTEDLSRGVVDRFRALPMARSAVLAGRTFGDLLRNTAVLSIMLAVGFAIGFRYERSFWHFLGAFLLALAFSYSLSWVMAFVGLVVKTPEAAQAAVFLPVFPLVFASSVFLPTETMPSWLRGFADHQPITVIADALRGLVVGPEVMTSGLGVGQQVLSALAWIGGITIVFSVLAVRRYRRTIS